MTEIDGNADGTSDNRMMLQYWSRIYNKRQFNSSAVEEDVDSSPLFDYIQSSTLVATQLTLGTLSLSVVVPGRAWRAGVGRQRGIRNVFPVNGSVIVKSPPVSVAMRFATSSVRRTSTSLTAIAGIVCFGGALGRRLPIRRRFCDVYVKLLSKIRRRRRRRRLQEI